MGKTFEKAVTGFNHNVKHKGKVYHVQTEDSGRNNPHIITHLFVGGNILATKKSSYAHLVNEADLPEVVRDLMEKQHKEMLRNLVNGTYDGIDVAAAHYQPGQLAMGAQAKRPVKPIPLGTPLTPEQLPPEVLAARQLTETPKMLEGGETLFGEDLISERTLDEVILSYLATQGEG